MCCSKLSTGLDDYIQLIKSMKATGNCRPGLSAKPSIGSSTNSKRKVTTSDRLSESMKTKLNVKLLAKVKKAIMAHPQNTDMSVWVCHQDDIAECGTVGCIAGWIAAEGNIHKLRKLPMPSFLDWNASNWAGLKIRRQAVELLNIDVFTAETLFVTDNWPDKLRMEYNSTNDRKKQARTMCKAIDWFIDWFCKHEA